MLVRLHTITLPIHRLHSDFFLGAAIPIPWQRKGMVSLLNASSPKSTNQNPPHISKNGNVWAYHEERQLKGPSWYSGCHISHTNELWSVKQLIHTVCLCRAQRNSWASGTITCSLLPACPQHMESREGQPKDSRALETNLELLNKGILGMSCALSLQTLTILWQAGDIYGHWEGEPGEWHLLVGKSSLSRNRYMAWGPF